MMNNVKSAKEQIAKNAITMLSIAMNVQMEREPFWVIAGETLFEIINKITFELKKINNKFSL